MIAWKEAHSLTIKVYELTSSFPKSEQFGMTQQLRRAAYSIETQLAEGSCMETRAHKRAFYRRAYGSAVEVDNFIELAHDLQIISTEVYEDLLIQINRVSFLTSRLLSSTNASPKKK